MLMRLCAALGILHPDHLLSVLSQRQLEDWIAFHSIEPWGTPVEDYHAALQTWGAVMPHMGRKTCKPDQFLPEWGGADAKTPENYRLKARAVYARASAGIN